MQQPQPMVVSAHIDTTVNMPQEANLLLPIYPLAGKTVVDGLSRHNAGREGWHVLERKCIPRI